MEQQLFLESLLFVLGLALLLAMALPVLIWRNTAETARLLRELLAEQETANILLAQLLRRQGGPLPAEDESCAPDCPPGPDDDFGPDEDLDPASEADEEGGPDKDRDEFRFG